jgi:hypothetical protein
LLGLRDRCPKLQVMRIYPASKTIHIDFWRALRAAGVPIKADWLDWQGNETGAEPTSEAWGEHWTGCVKGAAEADILLLYIREGERHCGALIEAGAALAAGKKVFAIVPDGGLSFRHHPNVAVFRSLEEAIKAIGAMG